jgi:Nucleotidyl transferase of unknown function (DUF2204)
MENGKFTIMSEEGREFCRRCMRILIAQRVPFLVGGAFALDRYAGVQRDTKDFDIFLRERDLSKALELLSAAGYRTELTDIRWLGKAFFESCYMDLIFGSANSVAMVDEQWFEYAMPNEVLGMPVLLIPVEEMIWSKAFVMNRDRFDGADIMHIFLRCSSIIDWRRLWQRFGEHGDVLLLYLIYFRFIYPSEAHRIPEWLFMDLLSKFQNELVDATPEEKICRGPLFSPDQYDVDLRKWGWDDGKELFLRRRHSHQKSRLDENAA